MDVIVGFGLILQFIMPGDEEVIKMWLVSISEPLYEEVKIRVVSAISGPAEEHVIVKITCAVTTRYDVTTENECCCCLGSMNFLLCYEMNAEMIIQMIELSLALSARLLTYSFHSPRQLYKCSQ